MSLKPSGCEDDERYTCNDCGMKGTLEELDDSDCPNGMAPVYGPDIPDRVVLTKRDYNAHIEEHVMVMRFDDYTRDEEFDRAMRFKDRPEAEVLRRLGTFRTMSLFYSKVDGGYIGDEDVAKALDRYGIAPERRPDGGDVCCIGFSESALKWYGWNHRAVYEFGVGHVVEEGQLGIGEEGIEAGFVAKTLGDCKRLAVAFARSVC